MTPQEFEETLIRLKRREPFVPFVVELVDGTTHRINTPEIAIGGGGAMYADPEFLFIEIASEEVRAIRETPRGEGMTQQEFEDRLRQFLRREPFEPFVIERLNGEVVEITEPCVAFDGGAATYMTSGYQFERFECENVRSVHRLRRETVS